MRVLDEGVDDSLGIFAVDLREHDIAGLTFHEGGNLAIVAAKQKVTFPVTRQRTVVSRSGALADGDCVANATVNAGLCVWCRERRIPRVRRKCAISSFFSAPRAWMNRLR